MITYKTGNILDATENVVLQQVNCKGVMGSGLAKQIRNRYPWVYTEYKEYLAEGGEFLGTTQRVKIGPLQWVINLFSQDDYGRGNKVYTDYPAFEHALQSVHLFVFGNDFSVAIPYKIGCGLANGDWNVVLEIIEKIFKDYKYDVVIYKLETEQ